LQLGQRTEQAWKKKTPAGGGTSGGAWRSGRGQGLHADERPDGGAGAPAVAGAPAGGCLLGFREEHEREKRALGEWSRPGRRESRSVTGSDGL